MYCFTKKISKYILGCNNFVLQRCVISAKIQTVGHFIFHLKHKALL